jgi:hypothetical protein
MMKANVIEQRGIRASIHWLSEAEGGRKYLPTSLRYSSVARFPQQRDWPANAWSVVTEFSEPPSQNALAHVRFLVEDAPQDWLTPGATFELLEGSKVVATVQVLG